MTTEGGFFERRPVSATGLTIVIAMHAAVLTAVALSRMDVVDFKDVRTVVTLIPEPKAPQPEPPKPQPPTKTEILPSRPTTTATVVKLRIPTTDTDSTPVTIEPDPGPLISDPMPIDPPKPPVRIAAAPVPGTELQPPYPPSAQRDGAEGVVVVRVLIGTDGRVKAVEKVSASDDVFFRATERQALLRWRFKPATEDGKPVESWKQMSVRFVLDV